MIAGAVLAGGASSRFGSPKFDAEIGGVKLGEIALHRLQLIADVTSLVGGHAKTFDNCQHIPDAETTYRGPLAGILSALRFAVSSGARWLMVTPCDVPLLPPSALAELAARTKEASVAAGMLCAADGEHPLCSVWSADLTQHLERSLHSEHQPVRALIRELGGYVHEVDQRWLKNVNTPDDLVEVRSLSSQHWWTDAGLNRHRDTGLY